MTEKQVALLNARPSKMKFLRRLAIVVRMIEQLQLPNDVEYDLVNQLHNLIVPLSELTTLVAIARRRLGKEKAEAARAVSEN